MLPRTKICRCKTHPGLNDAHDLGDLGLRATRKRVELIAQDVDVADGRGPAHLDGADQLPVDADQSLLHLPREALQESGLLHGLRLDREELGRLLRREVADVPVELVELSNACLDVSGLGIYRVDKCRDSVRAPVKLVIVRRREYSSFLSLRSALLEEPARLGGLNPDVDADAALDLFNLPNGDGGRHRCGCELTFVLLDCRSKHVRRWIIAKRQA